MTLRRRGITRRDLPAHSRHCLAVPPRSVCVSPMSSGVGECGLSDIVEEGPVGDVGEFSFEESEGFSFG